jgi:hypothetical protein
MQPLRDAPAEPAAVLRCAKDRYRLAETLRGSRRSLEPSPAKADAPDVMSSSPIIRKLLKFRPVSRPGFSASHECECASVCPSFAQAKTPVSPAFTIVAGRVIPLGVLRLRAVPPDAAVIHKAGNQANRPSPARGPAPQCVATISRASRTSRGLWRVRRECGTSSPAFPPLLVQR